MASKKDLRDYFTSSSKSTKKGNGKKSLCTQEVIVAETNVATKADVDIAKLEVKKLVKQRSKYQSIPGKVKEEIGKFALKNGTQAAQKKFSKIYPKYDLKRTSINSWKVKCKNTKSASLDKRMGRPNLLDDNLIKKTKDIIIGTRNAGTVISRRMVVAIGKG